MSALTARCWLYLFSQITYIRILLEKHEWKQPSAKDLELAELRKDLQDVIDSER